MLIMAMPDVPPQESPVMTQTVAIVQRAKPESEALYGTMGVCTVSPTSALLAHGTDSPFSDGMSIYPQAGAGQIFPNAPFDVDLQAAIEAAHVQILQQPQHGAIILKGAFDFKYLPDQNYVGNDKAVFLVDIDGHKVKVVYFIKVVDAKLTSDNFLKISKKNCQKANWRISSSDVTAETTARSLS